MSDEQINPREHDEALAACYTDLAKINQQLAAAATTLIREAGAEYRYVGRRRVPDINVKEAIARIEERLAHPVDEHQLGLARGFYTISDAGRDLTGYRDLQVQRRDKFAEISWMEQSYTGWSRFFVVTSSQGHIHSSMHCPSCYDTTTYGWLPQLSGKTEAEAVETCGPALCSVCFPSAPVEHQGGKLTEQEALELSQGKTIAEIQAAKDATKQAKADAKALKEQRKVERARKLLDKVEAFYAQHGGFEAVMDVEEGALYRLTDSLQATVADVVRDDWREARDSRWGRYNKDPRQVIAGAAA